MDGPNAADQHLWYMQGYPRHIRHFCVNEAIAPRSWAVYWCHAMVDADMKSLAGKEVAEGSVSSRGVREGEIPEDFTRRLFNEYRKTHPKTVGTGSGKPQSDDPDEGATPIPVLVAPFVIKGRYQHQQQNTNSKTVVLLWIPARLSRDGRLFPSATDRLPWISRENLEPANGELIIGALDEVDAKLEQTARPGVSNQIRQPAEHGDQKSAQPAIQGERSRVSPIPALSVSRNQWYALHHSYHL